jgi:uncharacterized membrane protein
MTDPIWVTGLRIVHIGAGMTAFFVAPVALATVKGGKQHRRWGKVYFWMMAVVALTALVLSVYRPIPFLTLVAIFSFYMAFSGYRVLFRKRPDAGQGAKPLDWTGSVLILTASVVLIALAAIRPTPVWARMAPVAAVFGATGLFFGIRDILRFVRPQAEKNFWWFDHMGGMIGSYIAAVSAFSVVNLHFLPPVVRWLWPTFIGVPAIVIWIGYYRRKFAQKNISAPEGGLKMAATTNLSQS